MKKILMFLVLFFAQICTFAQESIVLKDLLGNDIKLNGEAKSIAALWHANNQIILMLGGMDKVVLTTDPIKKNVWFNLVYPNLKNIPSAFNNNDIQIEEVIKLNPDITIVSNKNYLEQLKKQGIKAAYLSFTNYDEMRDSILLTANLVGGDALKRAKIFDEYINEKISFVKSKTDKLRKRPKVLHVANGSNFLKVDGANTIIDEWIKIAGGENVIKKSGNMIEITSEEILADDPDIVIIGDKNGQKSVEEFYKDQRFSGLKAVKNKQVYANPNGIFSWDRYGAEGALQILWAAKTIHPEIFGDINLLDEAKKFYKKFFDFDLSDEQFELIIKGLDPK
ncbi:ABC transporter substrate-binding protein [Campylobacter concisus]|uniref:ABC transporter substrate-binding protein n=1 Tax=Campylobacter concisus TaxID=199 RepID=UPI000CD94F2E|nr:ABC transporter substrate-binding protein [Campylobacter concisus]